MLGFASSITIAVEWAIMTVTYKYRNKQSLKYIFKRLFTIFSDLKILNFSFNIQTKQSMHPIVDK